MMNSEYGNITIGSTAPDFVADTTDGKIRLSDLKGKWVILFSHPGDFTPVCTTEFIAFSKLYDEFVKRNAYLLGLSIDSNPSHLAWLNEIYKNSGVKVQFPVIADRSGSIAKMYGMIPPSMDEFKTVRNVFIIDPKQKVRAILAYPLTNGRNIPEILRLLDAMQVSDEYNVATPANWAPGEPVINPAPTTFKGVMELQAKPPEDLNCEDWWLCYKNLPDNVNAENNMNGQNPIPLVTPAVSKTTNRSYMVARRH